MEDLNPIQTIRRHLREASQRLAEGQVEAAKSELEAALALDPANVTALALRERITAPPPKPTPALTADVRFPQRVATAAWIGFEQRIQSRRFSVLVENLRRAIAARDIVSARDALEEARLLRPDAPELDELDRRVASIASMTPASAREVIWRRGACAVLMLVLGVSMVAAFDWLRARRPTSLPHDPPPSVSLIESSAPLRIGEAPAAIRMVSAVAPQSEDPPNDHIALSQLRLPERQTMPSGEVSDNVVVPQRREPVRALTNETVMPSPSTPLAAATSSVTSPAAPSRPITAVPAATGEPAVEHEARVAEVLRRYARAYGELDARAARELWPTVDERALARAFDSLASQTVYLQDCDINVRGATAEASCRGHASYVGKIGSRETRIESRVWRFELRRDGDAWKIANAETQRPNRSNR